MTKHERTRPGDRLRTIEGCGLDNPDPGLFWHEPTGETFGSASDGQPVYRLTLKEGTMVYMGATSKVAADPRDDPDSVFYYQLPGGRYLRLVVPYFHGVYGVTCAIVDELPELDGEWAELDVERAKPSAQPVEKPPRRQRERTRSPRASDAG